MSAETEKLRLAIVDDEPLARMRLRRLLGTELDIEIVGECGDGASLLELARNYPLDAVLLDIEMPELNGFDSFRALAKAGMAQPMVVFCTAYDQYATRAFDIDAIDYLLKPVQSARLSESLERLRRHKQLNSTQQVSSGGYVDHVSLPIGRRMHRVAVSTINVVLAQANYLEARTDGRIFVLRQTLASFIKQLDPRAFVRVHRSCVIRVAAVDSVESVGSGRYRLRMRDGSSHYAARGYREAVRSAFGLSDNDHETPEAMTFVD